MSNYDNTNTGAIFKNEQKTGSQPDYRGTINVDGVDKQIALWVKDSKAGKKFFSAKISEPYQKDQQAQEIPPSVNLTAGILGDDDLPF
jgi:uncharacterized protein (DUF736 family)